MNAKHRGGVTLIEVAVSTVLVGVVLVASLETLGSAMRVTRETHRGASANALLGIMLAEAASLPLDDPEDGPGPIGQELGEAALSSDRSAVDDLGDLDGYSARPPVLADGAAVAGYGGWTQEFHVRHLSAEADSTTGLLAEVTGDQGIWLVECVATSPAGVSYRAETLRSAHGLGALPVLFDAERVIGCELELTVGSADPLRTAVATKNDPEAP